MTTPVEIQRAEVLDWWESEHERLSDALAERLPALYFQIDESIDAMSLADLAKRKAFVTGKIEPLVLAWIEKVYRDLSHELDLSLQESLSAQDGQTGADDWSYNDLAIAGAAIAVSAAPLAGIPFFAGGLTAAGTTIAGITFGAGALLALPVAALAGTATLVALGPAARIKAIATLKSSFRDSIHRSVAARVLGDPNAPERLSLKGKLLGDLNNITLKRLDLLQ